MSQPLQSKNIKLSSGAEVEIRKLNLADESILSQCRTANRDKSEKLIRQVMDRVTQRVIDPGPYPFLSHGKSVPWKKVIGGDLIDAMLQLRMYSYKEGDKITVPNIKCGSCRSAFSWEVNVDKDLIWQPLSEESQYKLKNDELWTTEIQGYTVYFTLATGDTEGLYRKLTKQNRGRDTACGFRSRIRKVEGPDGEIDANEILDWLDGNDGRSTKYPGLLSEDAEELREAMDLADGGVDLEVEATCPEPDCGESVWFDLPFDTLFLPGTGIRKRKMARRRGRGSSGV